MIQNSENTTEQLSFATFTDSYRAVLGFPTMQGIFLILLIILGEGSILIVSYALFSNFFVSHFCSTPHHHRIEIQPEVRLERKTVRVFQNKSL